MSQGLHEASKIKNKNTPSQMRAENELSAAKITI
jgi:hypothetical protein